MYQINFQISFRSHALSISDNAERLSKLNNFEIKAYSFHGNSPNESHSKPRIVRVSIVKKSMFKPPENIFKFNCRYLPSSIQCHYQPLNRCTDKFRPITIKLPTFWLQRHWKMLMFYVYKKLGVSIQLICFCD